MAGRGRRAHGADRNRAKSKCKVDENSPVIQAFYGYQSELDARHDKYERIVKLSRDITIESKRVIFLLQRCAGNEDQEEVLTQALTRIKDIQKTRFLPLALELDGEDHYQFMRAYSPGLQEYIEAVSFYHYLKYSQLVSLTAVQQDLQFSRQDAILHTSPGGASGADSTASQPGASPQGKPAGGSEKKDDKSPLNGSSGSGTQTSDQPSNKTSTEAKAVVDSSEEVAAKKRRNDTDSRSETVVVSVPPMEFMLGIADLTGELMRTAIMSVSAGNLDFPIQACKFMRVIHDAFMSYGNTARELSKKMWTLQQSLQKVENACYTLQVRGSEIPKHMLAEVFSASSSDGLYGGDVDDTAAEHL
ncbi:hypothetical protein BaRGS_00020120 [Batillaria attramentaria]|uniref:Translin-associated protein X n=1 Tax=Batillaria attramentaria TaxID=370345 RepID=A0ABD0KP25_9CAEN